VTEIETIIAEEENLSEVDAYRNRLQRLQADFLNYKRRVEREAAERQRLAAEELIGKLLPVMDDFGRALASIPELAENTEWIKGVTLVERNLNAILSQEGLERIHPEGEVFDPKVHEAALTETGAEEEQGLVKSVIRDGYRLHDKLIRPAQVSVVQGLKRPATPVAEKRIPIRKGGAERWKRQRAVPNARVMFS